MNIEYRETSSLEPYILASLLVSLRHRLSLTPHPLNRVPALVSQTDKPFYKAFMLRRDWLILLLLTAAEFAISGLLISYCIVASIDCFLVMLTLLVLSGAQIGHVVLISLQLSFGPSYTCLHKAIILSWSYLLGTSVVLLTLLSTSDCKTEQDFNVAFAVSYAEMLVGFFSTCCSMCKSPNAQALSRSQSLDVTSNSIIICEANVDLVIKGE
jgi:hypothetical protein